MFILIVKDFLELIKSYIRISKSHNRKREKSIWKLCEALFVFKQGTLILEL